MLQKANTKMLLLHISNGTKYPPSNQCTLNWPAISHLINQKCMHIDVMDNASVCEWLLLLRTLEAVGCYYWMAICIINVNSICYKILWYNPIQTVKVAINV